MTKCILLLMILANASGLSILIFVPGYSSSQILLHYRLAELLQDLGHNITLWTTLEPNMEPWKPKAPSGTRELIIPMDLRKEGVRPNADILGHGAWKIPKFGDTQRMDYQLTRTWEAMCRVELTTSPSQDYIEELKRDPVDIVIAVNYCICPVAIAHIIGASEGMVWLSPGTYLAEAAAELVGFSSLPSIIPQIWTPFSDRMAFHERLANVGMHLLDRLIGLVTVSLFEREAALHSAADPGSPSVWELGAAVPLTLVNGEPQLDFPRPLPYGVVYLGQCHSLTGVPKEHAP